MIKLELTPEQAKLQEASYDALIRQALGAASQACAGAAQGGLHNIGQNLPVLVKGLQRAVSECEAVIALFQAFKAAAQAKPSDGKPEPAPEPKANGKAAEAEVGATPPA